MALHAVDVHPIFQPSIDWQRVKLRNSVAICKTTEGATWGKSLADKNKRRRSAVRNAGMLWAPYHFARPSAGAGDPLDEADYAVWVARVCGWTLKHDLPLVLDIEATALSPAQTLSWCDRFAKRVHARTGRGVITYTGEWFWNGRMHLQRPPKYGTLLWVSAYVTRPRMRQLLARMRGFKPVLWQYTDKAPVAGIASPVDRSVALIPDREFRGIVHA